MDEELMEIIENEPEEIKKSEIEEHIESYNKAPEWWNPVGSEEPIEVDFDG